jgi:hypothetical protein
MPSTLQSEAEVEPTEEGQPQSIAVSHVHDAASASDVLY